jgi:hypothetical protein
MSRPPLSLAARYSGFSSRIKHSDVSWCALRRPAGGRGVEPHHAGRGQLGVVGFDVTHGAAAHDEAEAAINRLLCERAERVVGAADSSKLDRRAFARICGAELVDTPVTDAAADRETVRRFETRASGC